VTGLKALRGVGGANHGKKYQQQSSPSRRGSPISGGKDRRKPASFHAYFRSARSRLTFVFKLQGDKSQSLEIFNHDAYL